MLAPASNQEKMEELGLRDIIFDLGQRALVR